MSDIRFEQARELFLRGLAHVQAGDFLQAEQCFAGCLALVPGRVSALTNLGAVRLKLGKAQDAVALLDEALRQEPDNLEALGHRATALAQLGQLEAALAGFDRSLALQPAQGSVWTHRGNVLREMGRSEEAIHSFEQALAHGGDAAMNRYYLAALRGDGAPLAPPQAYVEALFDAYAPGFDQQLVAQLRYDAPRVLAGHLQATGRRFGRALDLGCGTGLCGPLLRPLCDALDGVDLSAGMLAQARMRGFYDTLSQADAAQWLAATPNRYGLVVAADVFIYVGALESVFAGVQRVLEPDGLFGFTVEAADPGHDIQLRPSLRYAHSQHYLCRLAADHGIVIEQLESRPVREDQRMPIPGWFAWLRRCAGGE